MPAVGLTRGAEGSEEDRPALQQERVERLLDRLADPVGEVEHHHGVVGRLGSQYGGLHRRAKLDDPLARQRNQAQRTQKGKGRRHRDVRGSDQTGYSLEVSEDRVDLLSPDDGARHDRHTGAQCRRDKPAPAEPLQLVSLAEGLADALEALGPNTGELAGVWPEGFKGVGKPFSERYKLQRFGRGGFVAAALRTSVPIVPCS